MADAFVRVPPDSTGKKIDTTELTVGGDVVERQRIVIGDNTHTSTFATVLGSDPTGTEVALVVRNIPSGTQNISGQLSIGPGTSNIGTINGISATVSVVLVAGNSNIGAVSLGAGTSNIGFINNISATVNVLLAAGSANFGTLNNISATVVTGLSYVIEKTSNSQVQVGDSANAAIRVNIVAGAAAGGTSIADRGAFTEATTQLTPAGGVFSDTRSAVAEDKVAALRITPQAGLHSNLRTDGGVAMDDSANSALRVNIVAGAAAGGTSIADRGVFTEATTNLTPAGGVYSETRSAMAEDRVGALRINAQAGLHVNLRDSSGNEISAGNALSVKVELISATASVILAAGTANIGTINNISAGVVLAAGTANIGSINNISATVSVINLAGTANMGAVSLAAGTANIGFLNGISATVVTGLAYVLDATGSQIKVGDSANSAVRVNIVADVFAAAITAVMSTSHGPKCVVCSVSANTTLVTGPGAGLSVYITQLMVSNEAIGTTVRARVGTSASIATVQMMMAAGGGGFVYNFDPPWKLSASEAALCSIKPQGANTYFNVNFYVAA
jgi:hypothetical protein